MNISFWVYFLGVFKIVKHPSFRVYYRDEEKELRTIFGGLIKVTSHSADSLLKALMDADLYKANNCCLILSDNASNIWCGSDIIIFC